MSDTPRYMCVMDGCPGEHVSKYLCCDFPEHQPGKWVPPLSVNTKGINVGICDATNYRIAWTHFQEYAEAIAQICNSHSALLAQIEQLTKALEKARSLAEEQRGYGEYPEQLAEIERVCDAALSSEGRKP